jgi:hypothetical protein
MANARNLGLRKCVHCDKEFEAYRPSNIYCSEHCRNTVNHAKPEQAAKRKQRSKRWGQEKKDHRRNYQLLYTYGISLEKYWEILHSQDDQCKVCKKHISEAKRLFAVDHDHKTGEIFGILCDYCNRQLIGRIRKPELFLAAAKYLEKGLGLFVPPKKKKKRKRKKK